MAGIGSAQGVVRAGAAALQDAIGMNPAMARRLHRSIQRARPAREQRWLERHGGRLVPFGDPSYPALLVNCCDAPSMLRCRGSMPEHAAPAVSIVGSRRASAYGLRMAARLTTGLVEQGCWVVSGGARGIDAEVHRTALRLGGRTVAILGSGVACPYPPEHAGLFERIVEHGGAVLSEFSIHQEPRPGLFPRRNRVISGMTHAVVVVEAARRSGALITARVAVEEHGRDAMVVPGPADASSSAGCHQAVRDGWAHLVCSADDVLDVLRNDYSAAAALSSGASRR